MIHCPLKDRVYRRKENGTDEIEEWGKFNYSNEIYSDFDDIRDEIQNRTNVIAGSNKGVIKDSINLQIFSPNVVNLTLVDLPGLTKIAVEDQPADIEQQIMKIVMDYIGNPNSIILAVSAANADVATSESLKIAKEVDPEGKRTLAILTKLDTVGDDAMDILTGNIKINIPVKLGIIGVTNRDIKSSHSISKQIDIEKEFLESKYPGVCHRNGIPYLEKSLSQLLMTHIHACLPGLKQEISKRLKENEDIMMKCGEEIVDKHRVAIDIIESFVKDFKDTIEGSNIINEPFGDNNLIGGPAIRKVFDEKFAKQMYNIKADISKEYIIEYLKQSGDVRSSIFPDQKIFDNIIMTQIRRLREPSLVCAENVKLEIERVIKECVDVKANFYVKQFPSFMRRLKDVMLKLLQDQMPRTREFINNIIEVELSCINTSHNDFLKLKDDKKLADQNNNVAAGDSNTKKRVYSFVGVDDEEEMDPKKEKTDAEAIEGLVNCYFALEKTKVEDSVPKSIVYTMVNYLKKNAQAELLNALYKPGEASFLAESSDITKMRLEAVKMLEALRAANTYIDQVYEINF